MVIWGVVSYVKNYEWEWKVLIEWITEEFIVEGIFEVSVKEEIEFEGG